MSTFEKIAGSMLGLVLVYLLVKDSRAVSEIMRSLADFTTGTLTTLQGR